MTHCSCGRRVRKTGKNCWICVATRVCGKSWRKLYHGR